MSLYQKFVAANIPVHNHESDLYVPATPKVLAIIAKHEMPVQATPFCNDIDGGIWLDLPFMFDPFWARKSA